VSEVIFGHARQAGNGPNPARQIAWRSGCPETTPAYTVNRACGSGLQSIIDGYRAIRLGDADVVLAGGIESMSNTPYYLPKARFGFRMGDQEVTDGMYRDGFLCPLAGQVMGETAENLAERYGIGREAQDRYAMRTQHRCEAARKEGRFVEEIVPVRVPTRKGEEVVATDEHPRDGVTMAALAKLPPVFREGGTVHAGNASGITDGGAAVLRMTAERARTFGLEPLASLRAYTIVGVDPKFMGIGPVPALRRLFEKTALSPEEIDLYELNEAFAVQVLACLSEIPIPDERLNVNGGAIALGHPIGCTGTRIVVTLLHEMKRRNAHRGVATLCISGGMGMALLFER
ncbi:MAG: thiolase family protein, partial [Deltaproteobacteria bacterium]